MAPSMDLEIGAETPVVDMMVDYLPPPEVIDLTPDCVLEPVG
jgi:hypothetical protein